MSAMMTPTRVTPGKSWPLATICVPMSTCASPRRKVVSIRTRSSLPRVVSLSMRSTRAAGNSSRNFSSTCCVPTPNLRIKGEPQAGQVLGGGKTAPQ